MTLLQELVLFIIIYILFLHQEFHTFLSSRYKMYPPNEIKQLQGGDTMAVSFKPHPPMPHLVPDP